jgi:hypothetical protein
MGLEIVYPIGAALLLAGLIWGVTRYRQRTRAEKEAGDQKTRELYGKN